MTTLARASIPAFALISALIFSGCLSNGSSRRVALKPASSSSSSSQTSLVTITQILRNGIDPNGTMDLLGDGSGSMGVQCPADGDAGKSGCLCVFNYNKPDPNNSLLSIPERIEVDTIYRESNLIRCRFDQIPSAVSNVTVSVLVKSAGNESNKLDFVLNGTGSTVDTSLISQFAKVIRYTCREKVTIFNSLDPESGIYDPIQSEDPANSFPLNFYTSNLGATINAYAGGVAGITPPTNYDCPADPLNPPDNYRVSLYSTSPLGGAGGDALISGDLVAGKRDMNAPNARSTFYLARQKTGVFSIAVNSYIAPNIISSSSGPPSAAGGGLPSLGFGASPISTGGGTERCPDSSVRIPTGYKWVKVWLFRTALPTRRYLTTSNLLQLGPIGCHPGEWKNIVAGGADPFGAGNILNTAVPDCHGKASLRNTSDGSLVSRFFHGTGACFSVNPGASGSAGNDPYSVGTDRFTRYDTDPQFRCDSSSPRVPAMNTVNFCSPAAAGSSVTVSDDAPVSKNFDSDDPSQNRYEFLFVVTPETVHSKDMTNSGASSNIRAQYTPYRFRVDSECNLDDPSSCNHATALVNYGLKLHDVKDAGDPPASSPNRPGSFPVCALQPVGL